MFGSDVGLIKELATPFINASAVPFGGALRFSLADCPDGLNGGDMGSDHRLACLKRIAGLMLPEGVVTLDKSSQVRPKNTTYVVIPVSANEPMRAMVNCVTRKGERVYKLTKKDVDDTAAFCTMDRLVDVEGIEIQHLMIGITRTKPRVDRSVKFVVRFLAGRIDFERRLFLAEIDEVIVTVDTRDFTPDLSRNSEISNEAEGPTPQLRRRNEDDPGSQSQ